MNNTCKINSSELPPEKPRRTFLNRLWAVLGALAIVEFGWFSLSILTSKKEKNSISQKDRFISPGNIDKFQPSSVTAVPEGRFYLACLDDGSFLALSRRCTHLGCALNWDEGRGIFICPCHGSSFDLAGEVLTPPATRSLDSYPLRIENGVIRVNISRSVRHLQDGKPRSVKV
jgi:cytochrome b6-f complex iron-sulfur subunit